MKTLGYYSNPKLAESVVQTLRKKLATMTWLDNTYPLVIEGYDEDVSYPQVNLSGTESYDLRPNTDVDSYCFFEFNDASVGNDDDPVSYDLSVVFWADLTKVDTSNNEDYTWNLIDDSLKILSENGCYDMSVSYDAFDSYSFDLDKAQLMRRYTGWKIRFTVFGDNALCSYT